MFEIGLSFKLMIHWGLLPPLNIMNNFLSCGCDDTDGTGGFLRWVPMTINRRQYDGLVTLLRAKGRSVSVDQVHEGRPRAYGDWFSANIRRFGPMPLMAK